MSVFPFTPAVIVQAGEGTYPIPDGWEWPDKTTGRTFTATGTGLTSTVPVSVESRVIPLGDVTWRS